MALAAAALLGPAAPAPAPPLDIVQAPAGCRLAPAGSAAPCPCRAIPADLRLLLELPLPLNRASAQELRRVPGLGPVRSAAIVAERARRGPFASVGALERVHGLGPTTVQRLQRFLFVGGDDPACAGERASGRP